MAQPGSEAIFLWLGTALMFLGMVAFIAMGRNETDPKKQEYYAVTILIPAIAFVSYLSMALGFGLTEIAIGDGTVLDIYWARYADWLFTTPLLLLDLGLLAGANRVEIGTLIGLDVMMILTGVIGAVSGVGVGTDVPIVGQRIVWWGVSTAFLLVLLYYLLARLSDKAAAKGGEVGQTFNRLRNMVLVLWLAYPVVWIIGTEGALGSPGFISLQIETALFMVLDVTAKVGFGFVLLRSRAAMEQAGEAPDTTAATAD